MVGARRLLFVGLYLLFVGFKHHNWAFGAGLGMVGAPQGVADLFFTLGGHLLFESLLPHCAENAISITLGYFKYLAPLAPVPPPPSMID